MMSQNPLPLFLVDDDKMFLTSLSHQLKTMVKPESVIKTFSTGEEFLKQLKREPSVIILDYYLNSSYKDAMNGLEVLKRIMSINPDAKVIILSSQDKMEVAVDTIKHGAYDYIVKNENVFLRTKLSIINAMDAISVSEELKSFKRIIKIVVGLILLIVAGCIFLQHYYPEISGSSGIK
ncbi:MAG: response regulator receiver protein [Bacteroidetes bacterium]|jgi:DNA-binding NarL/FixJ family response regulator|nr:response regulator receiver protein [Bacteroidota bacterium]